MVPPSLSHYSLEDQGQDEDEKVGRYLVSQANPIPFRSADRFQYRHTKSNRDCRMEWGWLARLADTVEIAYLGMEMKSE